MRTYWLLVLVGASGRLINSRPLGTVDSEESMSIAELYCWDDYQNRLRYLPTDATYECYIGYGIYYGGFIVYGKLMLWKWNSATCYDID